MEKQSKNLVAIINHFQQDLSWVSELKHPYIIYNKNVHEAHLFEHNLPNLGFDTIVYLKFIVDNYNTLPDYMAFLQDDPKYHCTDVVERVNNFDFNKPFLPLSGVYVLASHDRAVTIPYAERIEIKYKEPLKMIASCQCIVSKDLVLKTTKEMYLKIISTIDKQVKSQENYCIENLWPTILNYNEEIEVGCQHCGGYAGGC
jgi:hypothetical protein